MFHRYETGMHAERVRPSVRTLILSAALTAHAAGVASAAPMPDDLAALVPSNTGALVYIPSPEALEAELVSLMQEMSPENAPKVAISELIAQMLGPAGASWDTSRPMAVAAVPPPQGGGFMPSVTVVLPALDVDEALAAFGTEPGAPNPQVTTHGTYLGFAMVPGAGPAGATEGHAAILDKPFDADLTVRLDIGRLMASYGPMVEGMLAMFSMQLSAEMDSTGAEGAGLGEMMSGFPDKILEGLRAAERLDVTADVNGRVATLGYALGVRAGTDLAMDPDDPEAVKRVAARLPGDLPAIAWFAGVVESWMIPGDTSNSTSSNGADPAMVSYLESIEALYDAVGPSAGALGIDAGGMWCAGVSEPTVEPRELETLIATCLGNGVFAREQGVRVVDEGTTELEGVALRTFLIEFDAEELAATGGGAEPQDVESSLDVIAAFFGDGLRIRYSFVGDRLVYGMGDTAHLVHTMRAAAKARRVPAPLQQAFDRSELPANYVVRCDLRALAEQVVARLPEERTRDWPSVPAGEPVPVTFWNGHANTRYRGGCEIDVAGVAQLVTWLRPLAAKNGESEIRVEESPPVTID